MADLQGPKLRIGTFPDGGITLEPGDTFRLHLDPVEGSRSRVQLPHPEIFAATRVGTELLLDDGRIRLRVGRSTARMLETEVITGGSLSDRKGVNVPGVVLDLSPLSDKDHRDLAFALDLGVDWVALSFVQRPEDVAQARRLVGGAASLLIKLEKPAAIEHLDELVEMTDAVMVARGDLGVELPPEQVPGLQKQIVKLSRRLGKPVIVATQMLDSMVHAPAPTRAEASDVATAVFDSADAVMLSAETAAGAWPVESVAMMDRIIRAVEGDRFYHALSAASHEAPRTDRVGRHHACGAPGGGNRQRVLHRHLHGFRFDDAAGRPGAAAGSRPVHHLVPAHRQAACHHLGRARGPHPSRGTVFRRRGPRHGKRTDGGFCPVGRQDRRDRRRPDGDAGIDQRAQNRKSAVAAVAFRPSLCQACSMHGFRRGRAHRTLTRGDGTVPEPSRTRRFHVQYGTRYMPVGKIKWFNHAKGYGFIQPDEGGNDVFVHITALHRSGIQGVNEGDSVSYDLVAGRDGRSASGQSLARRHLTTRLSQSRPETPASAKVAMPWWHAAAACNRPRARVAPEPSPRRIARSSSGFLSMRSSRRR